MGKYDISEALRRKVPVYFEDEKGQSSQVNIYPNESLKKMIEERADDNMESRSKTVCNICKVYFYRTTGSDSDVKKKIIDLSTSPKKSISKTICLICRDFFRQYPNRKRSDIRE